MNDRNREDDVITQAEFRAFQRETQQALQAIQATLARLATGNNQQREEERVHENYRERFHPAREHNPAPRRQLAYEEELSDDEEFAEHIEAKRIENETEDLYEEEEITGGDEGELLSRALVVRRLLLSPKQKFTFTLKHKSGQLNKMVNALNQKVSLLITMRAEIIGFENLKELYAKDEDFGDI
ncbi:hypothetical protein SADUNF_Sadunf19G0011300 [Salix dunnii]|uniref:Uncharacterized protein n=1 Tax=Salix dunnii TaxID=1413687 RepID=A0A835J4V5_9ROSI|nr:hypothetical protein SADUNF_Sadunf19G0011300 [Salix dunnii]